MQSSLLYLLFILCIFASCEKDTLDETTSDESQSLYKSGFNIEGEYSGTFERNGEFAQVRLSLTDGKYSGVSNTIFFPLLCRGSYDIVDNTITFASDCGWVAIVDMTLDIHGTWDFVYEEGKLTLTNQLGHIYTLTKK